MKSSSMTTITKPPQHQTLMSLSSSNMGGSRSEDESAKLENLHKNKDDRIGSLTSISNLPKTKVLKTLNPQMNSSFKKRALSAENHSYSTSYTDISHTHNNNSIRASPFSVPSSYGGHSDSEQEKKVNLEKLRRTFPNPKFDMKKPFSLLNNIPPPDEESKENEEVLKNLPELNPYYLSERLVRDNAMMQNESSGNLNKRMNSHDHDLDEDTSPAESPFTSPKTNRFTNNHLEQDSEDVEFIAHPESFKDDYSTSISSTKKVRTRPPLTMTSSKPLNINDTSTNALDNDDYISPKALRRSSYLQAREQSNKDLSYSENEVETFGKRNGDPGLPRFPPPPIDMESQEARVIKRPGLPRLSTLIKEDKSHKEDLVESHCKYQSIFFVFKASYRTKFAFILSLL